MRGFHYSSEDLAPGTRLLSHQGSAARWKFVLPVYQDVAASRGLRIGDEFAYCYGRLQPNMTHEFCYEARASWVVEGNCRYSPLMALAHRLKREEEIREFALRYLDLDLVDRREFIGDWVVVG